MRLPADAHNSQPWRIHAIAPDFRLEDVWRLPASGPREDFHRLVEQFAATDPGRSSSAVVRALFALRWKLGELFGWDDEDDGIGERVPTLRDRLPEDLLDGPAGPEFEATPFTSLYLTENEWAAEVANQTMHGVLHLGWLPDGTVQMAVLVKPNGLFGRAYMAAIKPFRYLFVYPALLRDGERRWRAVHA